MIKDGNSYPAFIQLNTDANSDGSGLTWMTVVLIMAGTVFLIYIIAKLRKCHQKLELRRQAKERYRARLESAAATPAKFDLDRFEELVGEFHYLHGNPRPQPAIAEPAIIAPPVAMPPAEPAALAPAPAAAPQGQRRNR